MLLWSTGFIAAKYGLPFAPPLMFLLLRFVLVAALMASVAAVTGVTWPATKRAVAHVAVAGLLVHALYLGGVWWAIKDGMAAGTSAMIVGLQPLLTVVLARAWLRERVLPRQWLGMVLGLAGVWLVIGSKLGAAGTFVGDAQELLPVGIALVGISVGTLYQKRYCAHVDLRAGAVVQFTACALLILPFALQETEPIRWAPAFVLALGWSVLVLSVGAISLLYWLLRHGGTAEVARLFYLVPPVTALMAWLLFGETLDSFALAGMGFIAAGVALARPGPPAAP